MDFEQPHLHPNVELGALGRRYFDNVLRARVQGPVDQRSSRHGREYYHINMASQRSVP